MLIAGLDRIICAAVSGQLKKNGGTDVFVNSDSCYYRREHKWGSLRKSLAFLI